ncbi:MAG: ATP synthase F1 subunit delta [Elusimicrobiaceae bacterium]|nr:ATP synthase F1 subunit delta [Elusimicrobiaceae bacterium]
MNAQARIAAARYAAAYDGVSNSVQEAEKNAQELSLATQILAGVAGALQNPRLSSAQKKLVLNEALKNTPQAARFIGVLIDAKRLNLLDEICARVQTLLDDRKGISRAIVTSACELSAAQQKATQSALSKRYGKTVEAVFHTAPALLGGLKMACNGELLDGSVQTRLAKLQEELKG